MKRKGQGGCFSAPSLSTKKKNRLIFDFEDAKERAKTQSLQQTLQKLPKKGMQRMLVKLGAVTYLENKSHLPSEQQRKQFRKGKYLQLKRFYQRRRYLDSRIYESQLDEIVIDCYKPGQIRSNGEIWRQYRQNYDKLAYRTQKVIMAKRHSLC